MSKARELAELGAVYDSGALSNRNLIINGAFKVWQRTELQCLPQWIRIYNANSRSLVDGCSLFTKPRN